nr:PREDICTED: probable elongator complex protein 2 [Bemisia tabaci]XP_018912102.1 PREDICTED: probable elongator complex protein 2 [Bemisia tabaci]
MPPANLENAYVASSCNRTSKSVDCSPTGLVCFASCHSVIIYKHYDKVDSGGKVIQVLTGHTKRVNSVQWVKGSPPKAQLISVSADSTANLWTLNEDGFFTQTLTLKGHADSITVIDALYVKPKSESGCGRIVIFTASNDSIIKIWTVSNTSDVDCQTIDLKNRLCLSASLAFLPGTSRILAAFATDDCKINLYISSADEDKKDFVPAEALIGHEDWVQSLDFTVDTNKDLILASGSQDTTVRLWRFSRKKENEKINLDELRVEEKVIKVDEKTSFVITADSVLSGHEGWVYGVHWNNSNQKEGSGSKLQLLTSSMDKTLIVWESDESSDVWLEVVRLGEVGGNTLGFRGGKFGPNGDFILAYSYHGAFHVWRSAENGKRWDPDVVIGGHFDEVTDLQWDPKGAYLLSVSQDQTTRLHAPWVRHSEKEQQQVVWHELGRPQVHGYNLSCIAAISRTKFASGAEEKVVRTFAAPSNFLKNFKSLSNIDLQEGLRDGDSVAINPLGASVPALGLSNKAVYKSEETKTDLETDKNNYPEAYFSPLDLKQPPTEEDLVQNTLWPEIQKLYGHGYEIFSLAASHDGSILASACKATSTEHAAIILWDTRTWKRIESLVSHSLTITQLSFSPNDLYLLSVSRDRDWSLFKRSKSESSDVHFELFAKTGGKKGIHTRIIWCCSWGHDSKIFCTGSRDSKAVVWSVAESMQEEVSTLSDKVSSVLMLNNESITSCSIAPGYVGGTGSYLIALGCESGYINLYLWSVAAKWSPLQTLKGSESHTLTVKKLAFRPVFGEAGKDSKDNDKILQLASAGSDHLVRVYTLFLEKLISGVNS